MTLDQFHTILKPHYRSKTPETSFRLTNVAEVRNDTHHPLRDALTHLPDDLQLLTFPYNIRVSQCHRWNNIADWAAADIALHQQGYCIRPLDFNYNALLLWPLEHEEIHFTNGSWVVTAYGRDIDSTRWAIANAYRELFPLAKPLLIAYYPRNEVFYSKYLWDTTTEDIRSARWYYIAPELTEEKLCKAFNRRILNTRRRSPRYWQELAIKIL